MNCWLYWVFSCILALKYAIIVADIANISIELCEFKVLCTHALKQVLLCIGAVTCISIIFAVAISSMTREATLLSNSEFTEMGRTMTSLVQLAVGIMDLEKVSSISGESPYLLAVLVGYMLVVYSFFFNLLVSQFCGVYAALAEDILGHAMLARGDVILDTLKAIPMKRWNAFLKSLALDQRVDFEEGDIGLPGGIKTWEPSLAHPTTQDQIIRAGGDTDPSLPWPIHRSSSDESSMEKMVAKTIQKSLQKYLGKNGTDMSTTEGSKQSHSSSGNSESL
mmetsp:Transcript_24488/g.50885  ORF Transcript_24488/g.50885 Transcript_24488/m.50885 type:complete len:279 (+) Transcript_24488:303-1139(+)